MTTKQEYEYALRLIRMFRSHKTSYLFHDGYLNRLRQFRVSILMAAWNSLEKESK